jgi:hypothetical protein
VRPFFVTQGSSLSVFREIEKHMRALDSLEPASWFVADRHCYEAIVGDREGSTPGDGGEVLKEWDVIANALADPALADEIGSWEAALGQATMWPAIIADRRVHEGRLAKVVQDYRSPYTHEQMCAIAVALCRAFDGSFRRKRPDVVYSFGPNTAGAIIAGYVARKHGIPFLTLKSTKISNLISLSEEWVDWHPHIARLFRDFRSGIPVPAASQAFSRQYLDAAMRQALTYEGNKMQEGPQSLMAAFVGFLRAAPGALLRDFRESRRNARDIQFQPQLRSAWQTGPAKLWRIRSARAGLGAALLPAGQWPAAPFVLFPLNSEPEIAISVYNRYRRNQIEVARDIAESLPMGMKLVVKEHPRSWGQRPVGYYRRLAQIPNLLIAPADVPVREFITRAAAVVVLSSFVGLEAVLAGKPVLTLGANLYDFLPRPLIWTVAAASELPAALAAALAASPADTAVLEDFFSAVHAGSVPANLYAGMLGKAGRAAGTAAAQEAVTEQYRGLARYALERYRACLSQKQNPGV